MTTTTPDYQQQAEEERYSANLDALLECFWKGVSSRSIALLSFESGIDMRDFEKAIMSKISTVVSEELN